MIFCVVMLGQVIAERESDCKVRHRRRTICASLDAERRNAEPQSLAGDGAGSAAPRRDTSQPKAAAVKNMIKL